MNSLPFGRPVRWYRGNLHTHSTNADSAKSPRGVCAAYRRRGYDFISLTGHFNEQYGFNKPHNALSIGRIHDRRGLQRSTTGEARFSM